MQSPRITEAAFSLLGGEGRHGMHALVRSRKRSWTRKERGWIVISMKNDWKTIFPAQQ